MFEESFFEITYNAIAVKLDSQSLDAKYVSRLSILVHQILLLNYASSAWAWFTSFPAYLDVVITMIQPFDFSRKLTGGRCNQIVKQGNKLMKEENILPHDIVNGLCSSRLFPSRQMEYEYLLSSKSNPTSGCNRYVNWW